MENEDERKETENSKKKLEQSRLKELSDPKKILQDFEILLLERARKKLKILIELVREKGNSWVLFWEDRLK